MIVHRSADRFVSEYQGIRSLHLYSAGAHYDPERMGFGALIGFDEHLLAPGAGFEKHRHRDVDIVTWVLSGVLEHLDDAGRAELVRPGDVQVQHCGTGIEHVERNASDVEPLRFLQLAFRPSAVPDDPRYELLEAVGGAVVSLPEASLQVIWLKAGARHVLAAERLQLMHVIRGSVEVSISSAADKPNGALAGVYPVDQPAVDADTIRIDATQIVQPGDSVEIAATVSHERAREIGAVDDDVEVLLIELK